MREAERAEDTALAAEKAKQIANAITFGNIFNGAYLENARQNKKTNSVTTEKGLFTKWIAPVIADLPLIETAARQSPTKARRARELISLLQRAAAAYRF
jgi:hypothetical protein